MITNYPDIPLDEYKIVNHPAVQNTFFIEWDELKTDVINRCEEILSTVVRWKNWRIKAITSKETNREHILWMLDLIEEFYEELSNICNIEELIIMVLVHDLWEYRIWDIATTEDWAPKKKAIQKKHEKKVATILISQIQNVSLRDKCLNLLDRYFEFWVEENQPIVDFDTLYLLTKLFDTIQWLEYGLEIVFWENYEMQKSEIERHISDNFQEISNICAFIDAKILLSAKTHYRSFTWEERENRKRTQQKNLTSTTNNGIYTITNTILHRIKKKIKDEYGLELIADLWKMIDHFWDFSEKYQKTTSPQ